MGSAYVLSGRLAEGLALLERAVERDAAMGFLAHHALSLVLLGEAYLVAGRVVEAEATANRAVRLARQRRELGHEAYAVCLLADLAAYRDVSDSERYYDEAMALATELGMRPLVAHCHRGLGKRYRRTGQRQEAQKHLATATTMYREMEMTYWLEKAEREMKEVA